MTSHIWDYDKKAVQKSKTGKKMLLERLINFGIYRTDKKKIRLRDVKRYWYDLALEPKRRRVLSFFLWGK